MDAARENTAGSGKVTCNSVAFLLCEVIILNWATHSATERNWMIRDQRNLKPRNRLESYSVQALEVVFRIKEDRHLQPV